MTELTTVQEQLLTEAKRMPPETSAAMKVAEAGGELVDVAWWDVPAQLRRRAFEVMSFHRPDAHSRTEGELLIQPIPRAFVEKYRLTPWEPLVESGLDHFERTGHQTAETIAPIGWVCCTDDCPDNRWHSG